LGIGEPTPIGLKPPGWPRTKTGGFVYFTQQTTTPRPLPGRWHPNQAKPRLQTTL